MTTPVPATEPPFSTRIEIYFRDILSRFGIWTGVAVGGVALIDGLKQVVIYFVHFFAADSATKLMHALFSTLDLFLVASLLSVVGLAVGRFAELEESQEKADGPELRETQAPGEDAKSQVRRERQLARKADLEPLEGLIVGLLVTSIVTEMLGQSAQNGGNLISYDYALPRVAIIAALSVYLLLNRLGKRGK